MKDDQDHPEMETMVSVCMVTYNHEKWIAQAIEGVLAQKTSFKYELVIGEDCSTDSTLEVIRSYVEKFPLLIRLVSNPVNVGLSTNFSRLLTKCSGKYIAICEGDDFWTDPAKLEKQVAFLETNPNYIMCSHNCARYHESDNSTNENIRHTQNFTYDQARFLKEWVTAPLTCMFRNFFRDYTLLNRENKFCDPIFFYELLKHGEGYFMAESMATFRVHMGALSSGLSRRQWLINHVTIYDYLFKYNPRDSALQKISARYCLILFVDKLQNKHGDNNSFKALPAYLKRTPGVFERLFTIVVRIPYYILRHGIIAGKVTNQK
jgi:glycosyltransferase involved in cell wall biosynthesis